MDRNGWQLSEDGPDAYETYIVPAFTGTWAQEMVNRAFLRDGESLLDVACGTGIVARTAADEVDDIHLIHGIDINEEVIKKARKIGKNMNWHQGDVAEMPFEQESFDVILCQQGLQYFPDPFRALKEMHRVLAENGRMLLSVWRPIRYSPFYESLCTVLREFVSIESASLLSAAYTKGDYGKLKKLVEDAGFNSIHISIVIKQMSYSPFETFVMEGMMASPFSEEIKKMEDSKREEMLSAMFELNRNYIDDSGLSAPTESYIVSAKK